MIRRWLWIAALVLVADQVSKWWAVERLMHGDIPLLPVLRLHLAYNTGAAFNFLSEAGGWQNLFFIGVAVVVSGIIVSMLHRLDSGERATAVALTLVLGGAVGNAVDRVMLGYVVDFVLVYYRSWSFPVFNVADSAITVGAALLILDALGVKFRRRPAG